MRELHVIVSNKIATYLRRDGNIICGNNDYMIVFSFDSEWDAYEKKTARFKWRGKYQDVEFTGNTVKVPILEDTTLLQVGVYVDDFRTSTPAEIYCQRSARCGDEVDSGIVLKTGSATENGTFKAGDFGADGFSEFEVNVEGSSGIIEVDELPETGEEDAIYKLKQAFSDVLVYMKSYDVKILLSESIELHCYTVPTKPTENIQVSNVDEGSVHCYLVEDENDIFLYGDVEESGTNAWVSLGTMGFGTFQGTVPNADEATEDGYYAIGGGITYYQYISGAWEVMIYESSITSEEITVTPTKSAQEITPENADYISKAKVNPIPDEYIIPSGTEEITENGTRDVTDKAEVNVNVPIPTIIEAPSEITANGTYTASQMGADGISKVTVNVPIPEGYIVPSGSITITENGTYPVTDKEEVVVDVESSGGGSTIPQINSIKVRYGFSVNVGAITLPYAIQQINNIQITEA